MIERLATLKKRRITDLAIIASMEKDCHSLQEELTRKGLSMRALPEAPTSCCGRGCNGCVWEGYFAALDYWREQALDLLQGRKPAGSEQE